MSEKIETIHPSYLGTPIVSNVVFSVLNQDYLTPGYDFEDNKRLELNDMLVTVSQSKNIVKTQLVRPQGYTDQTTQAESSQRNWGYVGTVKEYISMGDYNIRLQGYIVGEEINVYPKDLHEKLVYYLEYPGSFMISGKFLRYYDFTQVIVSNYNFSEQRGYSNQTPVVINLLSDDYVEVKYDPSQSGGINQQNQVTSEIETV